MMKWKSDFASNNKIENEDSFYDIVDDFNYIESSFLAQYGIRLRHTEMLWDEFISLLTGLMPESPLGQLIAIRSEKDPERLKNFSPAQNKIRREWQDKRKRETLEEQEKNMESLQNFFLQFV